MAVVWLNGEVLDASAARISVADHGLTVGDGVFETMRTERGIPFAMSRHLARLHRSLGGLGLAMDRSDDALREAMTTIAATVDGPARVRLTVTGGPGPLGSQRDDSALTVIVAAEANAGWAPTGTAITVPWRRNEHSAVAGLKTTSYAENVVALDRAKAAGAGEALLANTAGALCEGTGSNVFVVHDGAVRTPPLSSGCLAGITRALVLEIAAGAGVAVAEADLTMDDLATADEVFLTSSTRDVQGQHQIDGRVLRGGDDGPPSNGPVTAALAAAFARLAATTVDP